MKINSSLPLSTIGLRKQGPGNYTPVLVFLDLHDILSLFTLWALDDFKLNRLTFG